MLYFTKRIIYWNMLLIGSGPAVRSGLCDDKHPFLYFRPATHFKESWDGKAFTFLWCCRSFSLKMFCLWRDWVLKHFRCYYKLIFYYLHFPCHHNLFWFAVVHNSKYQSERKWTKVSRQSHPSLIQTTASREKLWVIEWEWEAAQGFHALCTGLWNDGAPLNTSGMS